jgi:hypothetical protein
MRKLLGGFGDCEEQAWAHSLSGYRPVLLSIRGHLLMPSDRVRE